MSKILDNIDPTEIQYLHLLTEQGYPAFSIAHRIHVCNCVVTPNYVQFSNPDVEGINIRVDRKRIVLVEYGKYVLPDIVPFEEFDNQE